MKKNKDPAGIEKAFNKLIENMNIETDKSGKDLGRGQVKYFSYKPANILINKDTFIKNNFHQ